MHHTQLEEQLEFDFMQIHYIFDIPQFTDYFENFLEEKTESDSNNTDDNTDDKTLTTSSHGTF